MPHAFLDNELQQVVRDAESGLLRVDRLVQVWRQNGEDAWVLVHVEVQSQEDADFAQRMYSYNTRIFDRYQRDVASLGVLADERSDWRPSVYRRSLWGCNMEFLFPIVKLADWRARWAELEASENPFATVILAHLAAQDTRRDVVSRQDVKLALIRRLYERGEPRERILSLFRFIDWLLALPEPAEREIIEVIEHWEEERAVAYVTHMERLAIERGREEGQRAGREEGQREEAARAVRRILARRFGVAAVALDDQIAAISDVARLEAVHDQAITVASLDDMRPLLDDAQE
jgi:hypothetical protein